MVFAIVGINLSIVSLILQLSATRYNPFVVELFFRDSVSTFTLHFFVATAIFCLWINFLLGWTTAHFLPRISCVTMMLAGERTPLWCGHRVHLARGSHGRC